MASCNVVGKHLPEWFRLLRAESLVGTADVAELFGVTPKSLRGMLHCKSFPHATVKRRGVSATHNYWSRAALLVEWRRRGGLG